MDENAPLFTNDAIVLGLLMVVLGFVFTTSTSKNKFWSTFYKYVPALLMCYLIPSLLNTFGVISKEYSNLWTIAKNYLLPTCLVLMTLSIDLKAVLRLGPKALIMFLTATVGIVLGGPIAIMAVGAVSPETVGGEGFDAIWRGLATLAGSWIGGGANQTAMLEVYNYNEDLYSGMVAVDIIVANIWMAALLLGVGKANKIDKWLKADTSAIEALKEKVESYSTSIAKIPNLSDIMKILAVGFGATALAHLGAGYLTESLAAIEVIDEDGALVKFFEEGSTLINGFFWIVVIATTVGIIASFTKLRNLEGAGASKMGSAMIYVLVAIIGMKMDITKTFENPGLLAVGLIWMGFHVLLLLIVAKIIKAPFFFLAVGSKANVGGAASAPVVASAFHPSLGPVGVLLAVLGYALGTYGAILCAELMQAVSVAG